MRTLKIRNSNRRAFTLIELMIVVGIITLLMSVLFVAVLPWLKKADVEATKATLSTIGPSIQEMTVKPNLKKFKKDAGSLAGQISGDDDIATSQMLVFYLAPNAETWNQSKYYKGQDYDPKIPPQDLQAYIGGDKTLKYFMDSEGRSLRMVIEKGNVFLHACGEDGEFMTADDLIYDGLAGNTKMGEDLGLK
ncbi:MAG: type II secretion system GspH family protein [Planctomycetes bacterium]|nr:type II secretion system GspH family protein [Planctomycetota bacterium]